MDAATTGQHYRCCTLNTGYSGTVARELLCSTVHCNDFTSFWSQSRAAPLPSLPKSLQVVCGHAFPFLSSHLLLIVAPYSNPAVTTTYEAPSHTYLPKHPNQTRFIRDRPSANAPPSNTRPGGQSKCVRNAHCLRPDYRRLRAQILILISTAGWFTPSPFHMPVRDRFGELGETSSFALPEKFTFP